MATRDEVRVETAPCGRNYMSPTREPWEGICPGNALAEHQKEASPVFPSRGGVPQQGRVDTVLGYFLAFFFTFTIEGALDLQCSFIGFRHTPCRDC